MEIGVPGKRGKGRLGWRWMEIGVPGWKTGAEVDGQQQAARLHGEGIMGIKGNV